MAPIKETKQGVIFDVLVQPRASKNEIMGNQDGFLKIRLTSPPIEGKANKLCLTILAEKLKVNKSLVEIIKGDKSRRKTVKVKHITKKEVEALFKAVRK
jgi:hypothetical protein